MLIAILLATSLKWPTLKPMASVIYPCLSNLRTSLYQERWCCYLRPSIAHCYEPPRLESGLTEILSCREYETIVRRGWHTTDEAALQPNQTRASELSIQDGCLLWRCHVVVPKQGREAVTTLLHEGHPGVTRMMRLARGYVWWPGMDTDLEMAVKSCVKCQEHQKLPARAPLHPWEWPDWPWARLHVNYTGPLQWKMILVVVDVYSKWLEAQVVTTATSQATINNHKQ